MLRLLGFRIRGYEWQGAYRSYHENGVPREAGFYRDGQPHGEWRSWHENGTLAGHLRMDRGDVAEVLGKWDRDGWPMAGLIIPPGTRPGGNSRLDPESPRLGACPAANRTIASP